MGHYGKLVKNENKDFLKEYIVNEKFMTSEEYEKLKSEGKLNLSFSDFYTLEYDPEKYLRLGDYEQFMRECFHCVKSNLFNKSTKINMLHITCRCTEYDDTLYLLNLKSQDKNIYSYCDNIYDYFENKNDYYRMMSLICFNEDENRFYLSDDNGNNGDSNDNNDDKNENRKLVKQFNNILDSYTEVYLFIKF